MARLLVALVLLQLSLMVPAEIVQDMRTLQRYLQNGTSIVEVDLGTVSQFCNETCPVTVTGNVTVKNVGQTLFEWPDAQPVVIVSGNSTLTLEGVILKTHTDLVHNRDAIFPNFLQVDQGGHAVITKSTIIGTQQSDLFDSQDPSLSQLSGAQLHVSTLLDVQPASQNGSAWGLWSFQDVRVFYDPTACFSMPATIVTNGSEFVQALTSSNAVYLLPDRNSSRIVVGPEDVPSQGVQTLNSIVLKQSVLVSGCNVVLDFSFLDNVIFLRDPTVNLTIAGNITIQGAVGTASDNWVPLNALFVGAFSVQQASVRFRDLTVKVGKDNQLFNSRYLKLLPPSLTPKLQVLDSYTIHIDSWTVRKQELVQAFHNRTTNDVAQWEFINVTLQGSDQWSFCGGYANRIVPGVAIGSGSAMVAALQSPVTHFFLQNNMSLTPDMFPSGPINVSSFKAFHYCAPDPSVWLNIDLGNILEQVIIGDGGLVKFTGNIRFNNSAQNTVRGSTYLLLGAFAIRYSGVLSLQGSWITGNTPSFLLDRSHVFWSFPTSVQPTNAEYYVYSSTQAYVRDWQLYQNLLELVTRGTNQGWTGYWQWVHCDVTCCGNDVLPAGIGWPPGSSPDGGSDTSSGNGGSGGGSSKVGLIAGLCVGVAVVGAAGAGLVLLWRRRKRRPPQERLQTAGASDLEATKPDSNNVQMFSIPTSGATDITSMGKTAYDGGYMRDTDVQIEALLGEGTFGKVYKGLWRGTLVAVKTLVFPRGMSGIEKREKMAMMEASISSRMSHPNIVQTYTFSMRPLNNTADAALNSASVIPTPNNDNTSTPGSGGVRDANVHWEVRLILEFCDLGSLRDALNRGLFAVPDQAVRMTWILQTALDVAKAMLHLHQENVIHSDLKARNILLKSSGVAGTGSRHFIAKVADFGLSLQIDPSATHISNVYQGTMTHMAPEILMYGKISRAADVYAFGILLWELFTGGHAYKGTPRALLGHEITQNNRRPAFPANCPFEYQLLACRCWEADIATRPTFQQILDKLNGMLARVSAQDAPRPSEPHSYYSNQQGGGALVSQAHTGSGVFASTNILAANVPPESSSPATKTTTRGPTSSGGTSRHTGDNLMDGNAQVDDAAAAPAVARRPTLMSPFAKAALSMDPIRASKSSSNKASKDAVP